VQASIEAVIAAITERAVTLIDTGDAVARHLARLLVAAGIARPASAPPARLDGYTSASATALSAAFSGLPGIGPPTHRVTRKCKGQAGHAATGGHARESALRIFTRQREPQPGGAANQQAFDATADLGVHTDERGKRPPGQPLHRDARETAAQSSAHDQHHRAMRRLSRLSDGQASAHSPATHRTTDSTDHGQHRGNRHRRRAARRDGEDQSTDTTGGHARQRGTGRRETPQSRRCPPLIHHCCCGRYESCRCRGWLCTMVFLLDDVGEHKPVSVARDRADKTWFLRVVAEGATNDAHRLTERAVRDIGVTPHPFGDLAAVRSLRAPLTQ